MSHRGIHWLGLQQQLTAYHTPVLFAVGVPITLVEMVSGYSEPPPPVCHTPLSLCPFGLSAKTTALVTRVAALPRALPHSWSPRWPTTLTGGNP